MKAGDLYARMAELAGRGTPFVLATVTDVKGSSPRHVGAKMLVFGDGTTEETIGGGVLEREAIAEARACLASGASCSRTYELRTEGEHALGSLCGGDVTVFFEPHRPGRALLVIGAGHVGQKLCSCASMLDFRVVVLDSREDMVTSERFPEADRLICGDPARTADLYDVDEHTNVVIVTHSAEHDESALRSVIDSPAAYIGMIGSRNKVRTIIARLRGEGVAGERLDLVHAPIGLDIGAETPAELALCIMAEIVADQCGRPGGRLPAAGSARSATRGSGA
jgi:xanthine dehydrogenase accessory factor